MMNMSRLSIFKKKPKVEEKMEMTLSIPESVKSMAFWNICRTEDYQVVASILKAYGADAVPFWDALRQCLQSDGVLIYILQQFLIAEINNTKEKPQLFRQNGGITHLMSSFMKSEGSKILEEYVNPIIMAVNQIPNALEIDNKKVSQEEADANAKILLQILKDHVCRFDFLSTLITPTLSYVFNVIKKEVAKKWPENSLITIGGFIFLRFINPAIISPQRFGTKMVTVNETAHRTLILITKIVQVISNQPQVPFREECMEPFSQYVLSQYDSVNKFLEEASSNEQMPVLERSFDNSIIIGSVPTIIQCVSSFKDDVLETFNKNLEEVGGLRHKLQSMLVHSEAIRTFVFTDQNAALNEVMSDMKKTIITYETEIENLNNKIIDLYVKLGMYMPECKSLSDITACVEDSKQRREKVIVTPSTPKEEKKEIKEIKPVINEDEIDDSNVNPEDIVISESTDEENENNKEKVDEDYSGSDSEEFIGKCTETYKQKMDEDFMKKSHGFAQVMSVDDLKQQTTKMYTLPDELKTEFQTLIHTIHTLKHLSHHCTVPEKLYHVSVELIATVQKMSGQDVTIEHKNVECDNAMIQKSQQLIDKITNLIQEKIEKDTHITDDKLKEIKGYFDNVIHYVQ